ncbi:hypothetical protein [Actinomadura hibisca]|uniref:hypothetical protein n=1 Tax=Actinomadura hibisca TaxID=68565 RepID=UPI000B2FB5B3|nr:hypothetical protein [Actinomadura hibisca]
MSKLNVSEDASPTGLVTPVLRKEPDQGTPIADHALAVKPLVPDGAVAARGTAAWLWGLDVLPPGARWTEREVDLILPSGEGPPGDDPRWVELPEEHVTEESGVRLTSLSRTALDCARWLSEPEALAALDQFLRRGVRRDELRSMARPLTGYRGNKRLRTLLALGDEGAESPGESRTRLIVLKAGFPRPQTQIPVRGPCGASLYVDMGYPQYRVGLEYDGESHHSGRRARTRDMGRLRWLRSEMGWDVISVTKDVLPSPGPYLEALLTALLHRGWDPDDATMDRIASCLARLRQRRAGRKGR